MLSARMRCAMGLLGLLAFQAGAGAASPREPHEAVRPEVVHPGRAVAAAPPAVHATVVHATAVGTPAIHPIAAVRRAPSSGPAIVGGPAPARIANRSGISGTTVRPRS